MCDRVTNLPIVLTKTAHARMRLAAQDAYEVYLISRSMGIDSAMRPAWECWQQAEKKYLLTCHPSKWAAPGDAENLGAAMEGRRWS